MICGLVAGCSDDDNLGRGNGSASPSPALEPAITCPTLVAGENTLQSGGFSRRVLLALPGDPVGKPVLFGWHWLEGDPYQFYVASGLFTRSDAIVVLPFSTGDQLFAWHMGQGPDDNPDLILFDDVLACLNQQFSVDLERVWSMGASAGALWTAYLTQYRSDRLASVAMLSGGQPDPSLAPDYVSPFSPIPVLLEWGGDGDVFRVPGQNFVFNNGDPEVFSFAEASRVFSTRLRDDGHFVIHCVGAQGHTLPDDPVSVWWPFLRDHPRGAVPTIPADLSSLCSVP